MRIGVDGRKIPESRTRGPVGSVEHAHQLGMSGVFFRTVLDMSPTLDAAVLQDIRSRADDLGMYLQTGLGKVNPYANPEAPELRAIGNGDIVLGFRRMMEACAAIGCVELWVATANYKPAFTGRWAYDRFRTDVTWPEQLAATSRLLTILAPIARDLGIHLNLETHEEITSFELVRIVETVGADTTGIVFDTANVLQRLEHPVWSAKRLAPYVRQTHIKDAAITYTSGGLGYQMRPCGTGVVDFESILPILAAANPDLTLTIENDESLADVPRERRTMLIEAYDPEFLRAHPDLTVEELAAYLEMVKTYDDAIRSGDRPNATEYASRPYGYAETVAYIQDSAQHLREICHRHNLPLDSATVLASTS
ncbi:MULTISPECIES: sugar phosphate isomerase/epimerase family protein [Rhodococcus]|uniref:sugar phosphate isomerase/epimerase family protein n=1 Tax=Rhodococcus globerulus TaxID=33008 RepID=UPI001C5A5960|nr:sugar phosphate isomerase/epimerase family protein [Rhodococcus globerulus]QXW04969.1 sugar phosphate isomerase/epimerase [Rhodococcus globerulus]